MVTCDAGCSSPDGNSTTRNPANSRRRYLWIILALAIAARLAILAVTWRSPEALCNDSASYLTGAASLVHDGSFQASGRPVLFRTPGYPLLLAMCGVTGRWGFGPAQVVQFVLSVLLVLLTYWLALRLVGASGALWATAFQSLSVVSIINSSTIATDGLFALLLTAALYLLVLHFQQGGRRFAAAAGALVAVATYVRPVGLIFVPIVAAVLLLRKGRLANVLCFVSAFGVLMAPWYVRNHIQAGYTGLASVSEFNMLFYEANAVWAKAHRMPVLEARSELAKLYRQELANRKIEDCDPDSIQSVPCTAAAIGVQQEMARQIIRAHPLMYVYLHTAMASGALLPDSTSVLQVFHLTSGGKGTLGVLQTSGIVAAVKHYFGSNPAAALFILPELMLLMLQYIFGAGYAFQKVRAGSWSPVAILMALTVAAFLLVSGPAATARMRLPVEPLMNIAAGAGLALLMERKAHLLRAAEFSQPCVSVR